MISINPGKICSLEELKESILAATGGQYQSLGCNVHQTTLFAASLEIQCSSFEQNLTENSIENLTQNSIENLTKNSTQNLTENSTQNSTKNSATAPCSFDTVVNSIKSAQTGQQKDFGECKLYETTLFAAFRFLQCGKIPVPNALL